jgi:hypothetical protein
MPVCRPDIIRVWLGLAAWLLLRPAAFAIMVAVYTGEWIWLSRLDANGSSAGRNGGFIHRYIYLSIEKSVLQGDTA